MNTNNQEGYSEYTLFKVYDVLRAAGLTEEQSRETINQMQNEGILFRERMEIPGSGKVTLRRGTRRGFVDEDEE